MPEHRIIKLPKGDYVFREPGPNPENINQSVHNIYQIGIENARQNALLDLLSHILSDPAYQQLRNAEQLGYIVWTFASRSAGVQSFRIVIQSKTFDPKFLDERIEQFLLEARGLLAELTEDEFGNFISSIAAELLEADKTLGQETNRYWREISNECYVFDRAQREVKELQALTLSDLLAFFDKHISPESTNRRKISIQIWPSAKAMEVSETKKETDEPKEETETNHGKSESEKPPVRKRQITPVVINDYVAWKRGLAVYPLPIPGVF